jgi:hypothetical protein
MENRLQLSELRKMNLDSDQKKILNLIDSAPFKFFINFILGKKELSLNSNGEMVMDGKPYTNSMISKDQFKKLGENDIQEITIKNKEITVKTGKSETFVVILD